MKVIKTNEACWKQLSNTSISIRNKDQNFIRQSTKGMLILHWRASREIMDQPEREILGTRRVAYAGKFPLALLLIFT